MLKYFYNQTKEKNETIFEIGRVDESSIMNLATLLYSKKIVSLSLSKSVISFDNRLEAVRLSGQG